MEINRENLSCDLIRFHNRGRQRRLAEIRAIRKLPVIPGLAVAALNESRDRRFCWF